MEVVLFIVVVSVALVAVLKAFDLANVGSADPVLRRQSLVSVSRWKTAHGSAARHSVRAAP